MTDLLTYQFGGWTYSSGRRRLCNADAEEIRLSTIEQDLLLTFLQHPQAILTRDFLEAQVSGRTCNSLLGLGRRIDVAVARLRRKIETDAHNPQLIKTVRLGGYWFTPVAEAGAE